MKNLNVDKIDGKKWIKVREYNTLQEAFDFVTMRKGCDFDGTQYKIIRQMDILMSSKFQVYSRGV